MAEIQLKKTKALNKRVDDFLLIWHQFPIDYWWRKKYNVPFGSSKHREMNFIDMFVEFQEEIEMNKMIKSLDDAANKTENEMLGLESEDQKVVPMSKEEIDSDYNSLDLTQFDK